MKSIRLIFLLALTSLYLSGCGQVSKSHSVVKHFMSDQMGLADYDIVEWSALRQACHVSDSVLYQMRRSVVKNGLIKVNQTYAVPTDTLFYVKVKYIHQADTVRRTFYLNDHLDGVVGFTVY